ncbi:MAG: addiction module protein [Planctomycetes bacterium]|nr:addiction module protein [Planctomycetota bacterium]
MSAEAAKLLADALNLSEHERADLAACLFASLDEATYGQSDAAWEAEIERRLRAIDEKDASLIPWSEAHNRIFSAG